MSEVEQRIEPRRLAHRGSVVARGLVFELRGDESALRTLVLEHWAPRSQLLAFQDTWVLLWPEARRISADLCRGAPLVAYGATLSTAPLSPNEVARLPSGRPACAFVRGGVLVSLPHASARELEPSEWMPVLEFALAKPLPAPPRAPENAVVVRATSTREALGNIVAESPEERVEVERALARGNPDGKAARQRRPSVWRTLLAKLLSGASSRPEHRRSEAPARTSMVVHEKGLWQKLKDRVFGWVWQSQVGSWLGRRHAQYLGRMMEMFERGDYEQALRHAIPTSKLSGGGSSAPALLPPGARDRLELGGARSAGSSIHLEASLFEQLRSMYRAAFQDLERKGQILEAAFVLSELLQDDHAAVDFLERHGELVRAAELAEARNLQPELLVRQWFLAGNRERAMLIARRDGAFEAAIARLKDAPDHQSTLRLLWADHLAECGRFAEAVLVLDQAGAGSALGKVWLDKAIEVGGVGGARALALKCARYPDEFEDVRARAMELLSDEGAALASSRVAFARGLSTQTSPEVAALMRGAVRAVVRDRARGLNLESKSVLKELASKGEDGALLADLPPLPADEQIRPWAAAERRVLYAQDRGPSRLEDAVYLADGRVLVAKGEGGCFLYSRAMKLVHHFDVPAHRLVPSMHGSRLLSASMRDDITIVSQIDLSQRRCRRWVEAKLSAWAPTFDGSVWYVAWGGKVHALDVTKASLSSVWRSGESESPVRGIALDDKNLAFLTDQECWVHALAPHRLQKRWEVEGLPALSPSGLVGHVSNEHSPMSGAGDLLVFKGASGTNPLPLGSTEAIRVELPRVFGDWLVFVVHVAVEVPPAVDVLVVHRQASRSAVVVRLEGSSNVRARIDDECLTVCDEHGRVRVIDLKTRADIIDARL